MIEINKILVPLDGSKHSKRALDLAISISKNKNAKITGLHVIRLPIKHDSKIKKQYKSMAMQIINDAMKNAESSGMHLTGKIIIGHPGKEIIGLAQKGHFDLIVMGSRGPNPIAEMFLGSVANYVLNKSKIPVLIIK